MIYGSAPDWGRKDLNTAPEVFANGASIGAVFHFLLKIRAVARDGEYHHRSHGDTEKI